MSSPSLPDSKSLTADILGLANELMGNSYAMGMLEGPGPDVALRSCQRQIVERLAARIKAFESELTELREDARTNRIRTSGQAEAISRMGVVSTTRTPGPGVYVLTDPGCIDRLTLQDIPERPVELGDEEGG